MQTSDEQPPETDARTVRRRFIVAASATVAVAGAAGLHPFEVLPPG